MTLIHGHDYIDRANLSAFAINLRAQWNSVMDFRRERWIGQREHEWIIRLQGPEIQCSNNKDGYSEGQGEYRVVLRVYMQAPSLLDGTYAFHEYRIAKDDPLGPYRIGQIRSSSVEPASRSSTRCNASLTSGEAIVPRIRDTAPVINKKSELALPMQKASSSFSCPFFS